MALTAARKRSERLGLQLWFKMLSQFLCGHQVERIYPHKPNQLGMNYRKQHYVPQFYLRNFSPDKKRLCCCSLVTKISVCQNIKDLCSERLIYGGSERVLSKLEDKHAKIIREILQMRTLANKSRADLLELCRLVLLMATRTKGTKERVEDRAANYDRLMEMLGVKPYAIRGKKLIPNSLNVGAMELGLNRPDIIADLTSTLLTNQTSPFTPLVTSDSPVLFYNLLARGLTNKNLTGFLHKGLIIFLPLSKDVILCLFDGDRYKLKSAEGCSVTSDGNVMIPDSNIFDFLNRNLVIKADWFVIFSRPEDNEYILSLQDDGSWGPRHIPVPLKLPFFEIYKETTVQELESFPFRNEKIAASLMDPLEKVSEKLS
jgi:hypothetical protein